MFVKLVEGLVGLVSCCGFFKFCSVGIWGVVFCFLGLLLLLDEVFMLGWKFMLFFS